MLSTQRLVLCSLCVLGGCGRETPAPAPLVPQVGGTIAVTGLSAPVRVVRDRWGVPHISAQTQDDLFVAQGFVQAQDRLFQMDLWRRAAQGRLSQVLGPNFVERDAMTRRVQYRGDLAVEWASYGPDAKAIAEAFVRGVNAWVARARARPPEEFALAGWRPEFWSAGDLLNRTDAFTASGDALDEIRRRGISEVVGEAVRRAGTRPFFVALAGQVRGRVKADAADIQPDSILVRSSAAVRATASSLAASEAPMRLAAPSARYIVHLVAPGWNVIGVTSPWLPGVAAGHNERAAWASAPLDVDTQDIYAEPAGAPKMVTKEAIVIKGRGEPFVFDVEATPHGVVIASDREHQVVYTIRWSGTEPGAAGELASLAIDRAGTWPEFRAALSRWKMPARRFVYAGADGHVGSQDAALAPVRRGTEWTGWLALDRLPHALDPRERSVTVTSPARHGPPPAPSALFEHVLGITAAARARFDVGPLPRPAADDSPVRLDLDVRAWDRSRAINAPGQSGWSDSLHFSDLAALWSDGKSFPLAFSDAAVQANAESTLMLVSAPPAARTTK